MASNVSRIGVVVATLMSVALGGCASEVNPSAIPSTRSQPALPSPAASTAASLPDLRLPGTSWSPAGTYGWEPGQSGPRGMHRVVDSREATAIMFGVGTGCLQASQEQQVPVRIAGFDAVVVEPYEPPVSFGGSAPGETTRAHQLHVGDRILCVYMTWNAATTNDELAAAERALETIRAGPIGEDRVRLVITLEDGWDTG